jgi:Diadenosine tetraphosphate (Ap4A) hydrolase and other HIT family hydrolases
MNDCLFCKILKGDIPSEKIYENDLVYAFPDIHPQAPVHILVIPKAHVADAAESAAHDGIFDACLKACVEVAKLKGIDETGYRIITNTGKDARQSVSHLHFHVLGGAELSDQMA